MSQIQLTHFHSGIKQSVMTCLALRYDETEKRGIAKTEGEYNFPPLKT